MHTKGPDPSSDQTIQLLCPDLVNPNTGALDDRHPSYAEKRRRLNEYSAPYTYEEIRNAIRMWHELPENLSIYIDIKSVYPWLGREWRDVFDLYAAQYPMQEIANYYRRIKPGRFSFTRRPDRGRRIVARMVEQVQWYLALHLEPLKVGDMIRTNGIVRISS